MAFATAIQQAFSTRSLSLDDAFGEADITTPGMAEAIRVWFELYYARTRTGEADPSQRIPYTIVNKLTRTVFSEYEATSDNAFAQMVLVGLDARRKNGVQQALIGGEALLKPIFDDSKILFSVIDRNSYRVYGRNSCGELTDIGTTEITVTGGYFYTLLERRRVNPQGYLTITNTLYRALDRGNLGNPVPLNTLPKYETLVPEYTYGTPVYSVGLIPIRTPMENGVDGSDDSVSIFEPAVGLINLIAINEAQINGEFERGQSRIIVSSDMMEVDDRGNRSFKDNIFSGVPEDPDNIGVTIFSPAFREQSFLARKTEYLRNIEAIIGFQRGILAEVETVERTATEVTSSKGDYAITIGDLQQMWQTTVLEALRVCAILGKAYNVPGAVEVPEDSVIISFGDGILYDREREWNEYTNMVARGMLDAAVAVAWYFDLPFPETEEERNAIRDRYMPRIDRLISEDDI